MSDSIPPEARPLAGEWQRLSGLRWQDLPPTHSPHPRPRRPWSVRVRAWLLGHGRLLTAAVALAIVLVGVAEVVR